MDILNSSYLFINQLSVIGRFSTLNLDKNHWMAAHFCSKATICKKQICTLHCKSVQKQIAHFTVNQEGGILKAENDLLSHEAPKGNCRVSTGEVAICLRRRRTSRELLFSIT